MKQCLLSHQFPLSLSALAGIRQSLKRQLNLLQIADATAQTVELVTTEYLTNLLQHQAQPSQQVILRFYKQQQVLIFEIEDDGPGWPALTTRLDQASLPSELATNGMGLGLIAALLPEHQYHHKPGQSRLAFVLPEAPPQPTVLVIDDSASQLNLLREYLNQDYQVIAFSAAREALDWLASNECDLVITDLHMPQMSGFELRRQVAQLPKHSLLPFIFLTGDELPATRNRAATQAIDDYLIKPAPRSVLLDSLARVLARHQNLETLYEQMLLNSLLPQLTETPFATSAWQRLHQSFPENSGDFLLSKTVSHQRTLLVLGDQMGHGPVARANGAAWIGFMQGLLNHPDITPSRFISLVNQELYRIGETLPHLMCLMVLEIDDAGTLQVINAGMPPYILQQQGHLRAEAHTIGLLGIDPEVNPVAQRYELAPGDSFHGFSDGVAEQVTTLTNQLTASDQMQYSLSGNTLHQHLWQFDQQGIQDDKKLLSLIKR
ncbi:response regulator [Photobacterium atrarenae]|uniref:Response regulator n=1 Tax=Photobacterium atrarenae TaxID=865757 RepID=A0ABY5GD05_9GAMM|nr:response regulator [Photobacterium atrarenae]UTV26741.1 response regulator [Photobacterium atrarenae]